MSYPNGFNGDQDLLEALMNFFNAYFKPIIPVSKEHIATAPGAAFAIDSILYNICDPGDGLLVMTPCWSESRRGDPLSSLYLADNVIERRRL